MATRLWGQVTQAGESEEGEPAPAADGAAGPAAAPGEEATVEVHHATPTAQPAGTLIGGFGPPEDMP
jgi:hypothetical protein